MRTGWMCISRWRRIHRVTGRCSSTSWMQSGSSRRRGGVVSKDLDCGKALGVRSRCVAPAATPSILSVWRHPGGRNRLRGPAAYPGRAHCQSGRASALTVEGLPSEPEARRSGVGCSRLQPKGNRRLYLIVGIQRALDSRTPGPNPHGSPSVRKRRPSRDAATYASSAYGSP